MNLARTLAPAALVFACGAAVAQPLGTPVYSITTPDANTGANVFLGSDLKNRWSVTAGSDNYFVELYERPTASGFTRIDGRFAAEEYYEYLDITEARFGFDNQWIFVRIDLVGLDKIDATLVRSPIGLTSQYGFRFSSDADGRFGFMVVSDQPQLKNLPNTLWGSLGTSVFEDTNGDVGGAATSGPTGLTVSKQINTEEESGLNGYDAAIVQDGQGAVGNILFVRISPTDPTVVELALNYLAFGLTRQYVESIRYFDVFAQNSLTPNDMHLNDKYSAEQAGSPNPAAIGNESEFGTPGNQSISEIDSVRLIGATTGCAADFNRDGQADFFDYLDYSAAFGAGAASADFNNDGQVDFFDFLDFSAAFSTGC
ncbi:MAG: hypothetical protein SFZ23_06245 [Planctomycetota bacterium]|nr:hypothetical protein [Planctomycetota bacterium]